MRYKTLQNAKNYSNKASSHVFENMPSIMLGGLYLGHGSIDDIFNEIDVNTEQVVNDTIAIALSGIGEVKVLTTKTDPSGFAQIDRWVFKEHSPIKYEEDTVINILGKQVLMKKGYGLENIVLETKKIINSYIEEGKYFNSLKEIDNTTIEVEYNDRRSHNPTISLDENRFYVDRDIIRHVMFGYGKWSYLGKEVKKFESTTVTLFYYQRVG